LVTFDGLFRKYIKKEKSGKFAPLMNTDFGEGEMFFINAEL